jgi:sugar/nucleoside kinase (ribokinase family)
MSERFDVVGVGINSVDRVAVLPGFPRPSGPLSKMRLSRYQTQCGGQTATAMVACARLGLRVAYVGAVGDDADGMLVRQALARTGVDATKVMGRAATTRFALILVDEASGDRAVLWDFDERLKLADADLPADRLRSARRRGMAVLANTDRRRSHRIRISFNGL